MVVFQGAVHPCLAPLARSPSVSLSDRVISSAANRGAMRSPAGELTPSLLFSRTNHGGTEQIHHTRFRTYRRSPLTTARSLKLRMKFALAANERRASRTYREYRLPRDRRY